MILELYAGKKKILDFIPFYDIGEDGKINEFPEKDRYAIHGGKVKSEKQIRKWASEYGYTIKNVYQSGDFNENNCLP